METLTDVQHEIVRQAIRLAKDYGVRGTAKLRMMLALEGYNADDIKAALHFWGEHEAKSDGIKFNPNQVRGG